MHQDVRHASAHAVLGSRWSRFGAARGDLLDGALEKRAVPGLFPLGRPDRPRRRDRRLPPIAMPTPKFPNIHPGELLREAPRPIGPKIKACVQPLKAA